LLLLVNIVGIALTALIELHYDIAHWGSGQGYTRTRI